LHYITYTNLGGIKKMKKILKKTWLLTISILLVVATVLPSINAMQKAEDYTNMQTTIIGDIYWEDNFDSYAAGSAIAGQGGWEGWGNDPGVTAYVSDAQSRSSPNSVDIRWYSGYSADVVQRFTGVNSGTWILTLWQYIPIAFYGISWIPLLNVYDPPTYQWSTDIQFDGDLGEVLVYEDPTAYADMIFDEWVEIRVEIDFDMDIQTIYYDGVELSSIPWGNPNFAALDLYAGDTETNSVYYDDITLEYIPSAEADLDCAGELAWVDVEPGATVTGSFTISNIGADGTELNWEIDTIPDWGTWTFDAESGTLTPEESPLTINVEVVAPEDPDTEFDGEVKIVNTDDTTDYCEIDASLATPLSHNLQIIEFLMERFPVLAKILEALFG
jgi:hypothetical protein